MSDETPEQSKVGQFTILHFRTQQFVDMIEYPIALLDDVITDKLTIDVPHGHDYTLLPLEDTDVAVLKEVYRLYMLMGEPTRLQYVLQQRADALVQAVEDMFGFNEFKSIANKDEMVDLIAFHRGINKKHNPTIVKRPRIGAMYDRVVNKPPEDPKEEE